MTLGPDSGPPKSDATVDQTAPDAGPDVTTAPKLLMTYLAAQGELATFDPKAGQVSGRVSTPGYPVVVRSGSDTFLIDTSKDLVEKLDATTLASVTATWNVTGSDDAGTASADPIAVIESAPNHAYVLRFNRNRIGVIDPSQATDAGQATSFIDLSSLVQPNDGDGTVDMVGGAFDATRKRLYVVLGNADLTAYGPPPNYPLLCVGTSTTLVAIDTTNDTLVNLGGSGPGGGVVLNGYNPQMGYYGGVTLDVAGDRILVVTFGCAPSTDGGVGAIQQRTVDAIDLKTNAVTTLLDANGQDIPNAFKLVDSTHAVIQYGSFPPYTTWLWDMTQPTLGTPLAAGPDVFDYDGTGHILGPQVTTAADGGPGPTNVVSVALADGGLSVLGQNPFLQTGGYNGNTLYVP